MVFKRNEVRTFPTSDQFLGNKRLNDIIYGFFQTHSYLTENKERYCLKKETSAARVVEYFQSLPEAKDCPVSERTVREMIKLFAGAGILKEGELDKKKVYFLPDLEKGEFVYIKTDTLRYLVNTATSNVIKVYAFLKKKYQQHIDFKYTEPYRFSQRKLLEVLGYNPDINNAETAKMVKDIINCLENNKLIEASKSWVKTDSGNATNYYILENVYEDYYDNFPAANTKKSDNVIATPVPLSAEEFRKLF